MDRRTGAKGRIDKHIDHRIDDDKRPVFEGEDGSRYPLDRTPEERFEDLGVTEEELRQIHAALMEEFHEEPHQLADVDADGLEVAIDVPGFDLTITADQVAALETVGQLYDLMDAQLSGD